MESPNPFSREAFLAPAPPPKPSKPLRSPRSKRIIAGLAGAALLCGGAAFVGPYLVRERHRNPYPTTQNGLTLRAIHASDYEPIQSVGPNSYKYGYPTIEIELPRDGQFFHAEGRASTGDTVFLKRGDSHALPTSPLDLIWGDRQSAVINLPQYGVPASFGWLDVTVEDTKKRRGTWRVYGLPFLKHVLPEGTSLRERQTVHGIAVSARAWQNTPIAQESSIQAEIKAVVPASALPRPSEVWSAHIKAIDLEWEPPVPASPVFEAHSPFVDKKSNPVNPLIGPGVFYANAGKANASGSPTAQHLARIQARLVRYEVTMETVTFRNLPLLPFGKGHKVDFVSFPPFLVTPSGVRVELQSPGRSIPSKKSHARNDVAITYQVSVKPTLGKPTHNSLIQSAIPADETAYRAVENDYSFYPSNSDPNKNIQGYNYAYLINVKNAPSSVLPSLTIRVAHQIERESIPITFVVSVAANPPTEP